jgi:hypothetical protein
MIDCSKTENYFAERRRMTMTAKYGICKLDCTKCPLSSKNNGTSENLSCANLEIHYPEKAVAIVQKWSDEHPQKTYLSEFLKTHPNALLDNDGTPQGACLYDLGLISKDDCRKKPNCIECWNQPIEESESK